MEITYSTARIGAVSVTDKFGRRLEREFELLLRSGAIVRWPGIDGIGAVERYVDCHREAVVTAWREIAHGLFIGAPRV